MLVRIVATVRHLILLEYYIKSYIFYSNDLLFLTNTAMELGYKFDND